MNRLEKMEQRLKELVRMPIKNKEEVDETLLLAKELELEVAKEYSSMIKELANKGITITNVWDLVNTAESYLDAIPILLNHVTKNYRERSKEGIIRSLAVKEARGVASSVLIAEYHRTPKDKMNLRWVIGNTVFMTFTEDDIDSILPIVQDKTNGESRDRFIEALGKSKSIKAKAKVEDVLIELLDDDEVLPAAVMALGRMKSKKAKEKISTFTNHPTPWIKKEVQKALKKIS